eukprot:gb/GFBE01012799.1/.p1 GENE.gb/GFBE01012799.1/~~gb/GFBE01012799.1/.p1  ORF type:complete len:1127 (+),score=187.65 gb/GFBE01012799.1/:1-3381(+)
MGKSGRGERQSDRGSELQRWLLLLAALATFLIFAPRGLLIGFTVIAVLGARLPQRWLARLGRSKVLHSQLPVTGEVLSKQQRNEVQGSQEQQSGLGASSPAYADGDWGPSLVLVFEAKDPVSGAQQLRIHEGQLPGDDAEGPVRPWTLLVDEEFAYATSESHDPDNVLAASARTRTSARAPVPLTCDEMLKRLRDAGLEYRLGPSRGGEYIFCMVRLPELTAKANLSFYPVDLELHPVRARKYAAELGMPLAKRVRQPDDEPRMEHFSQSPMFGKRALEAGSAAQEGLPEEVWEDLHLRFVPTVPSCLFRHVPLVPGSQAGRSRSHSDYSSSSKASSDVVESDSCVSGRNADGEACASATILQPSERLRMLLSLVADDLPGALGERGPGLKLDTWRKPKLCNCLVRTCRNFGVSHYYQGTANLLHQVREVPNAFLLYFLMQDPRDEAFLKLRLKFGQPASPYFRRGLFSGIVDKDLPGLLQSYFGQQIGFYFAFMQHLFSYGFALSVLLAPLLAVYSVDWARHLVKAMNEENNLQILQLVDGLASEITSSEASRSRWPLWSLLVGLTTTVWGQCVIESWHRKKQRLAKAWGSSRVDTGSTLRPNFRGQFALSRVDGRLMHVHFSQRFYQARVVAANLIFLLLWGLVFTAIGIFFAQHLQVQVATEDYASLGVMFSVVSVILHNLFRVVAHLLTEAENHRDEESWETSILVKKWALTVIVQCWATMHLLFIRPLLWPCAYGDPEVRRRLGVEDCAFWDQDCCDVELRSGKQVVLSFADVRSEAVVRHTRQFIAGWLVSKIFAHNLLKWIVPRLCGFLCTRGLYPLLPVDFAEDLLTDLTTSESNVSRQRRSRCRWRCCLRRSMWTARRWTRSQTELSGDPGPSALPEAVASACEKQLDKQDPWDVLDTAVDLSVHFLVTSLTTVIYPFAPLLFLAQLLVEFQMDLFQLFERRQPKPRVADGLPKAWLAIFQSYVYVGALSNLAIVTWRTTLVTDLFGEDSGVHIAFFSTSMLLLVLVVGLVQLVVPRVPSDVKEHLQRQREVEAFFIGHSSSRQCKQPAEEKAHDPQLHLAGHEDKDSSAFESCETGARAKAKQAEPPARYGSFQTVLRHREDAELSSLWRRAQSYR